MTTPLPARGATDWYAWAQDVHGRAGTVDPNAPALREAFEVTEAVVTAGQMVATFGTPVLSHTNTTPVYLMDAATAEIVSGMANVPRGWTTMNVDLLWVNMGVGSGAVTWRFDIAPLTLNVALSNPPSGTPVIATAQAAPVLTSTRVVTGAAAAAKRYAFEMVRLGADAADTLPNDVGLVALVFTKVN